MLKGMKTKGHRAMPAAEAQRRLDAVEARIAELRHQAAQPGVGDVARAALARELHALFQQRGALEASL